MLYTIDCLIELLKEDKEVFEYPDGYYFATKSKDGLIVERLNYPLVIPFNLCYNVFSFLKEDNALVFDIEDNILKRLVVKNYDDISFYLENLRSGYQFLLPLNLNKIEYEKKYYYRKSYTEWFCRNSFVTENGLIERIGNNSFVGYFVRRLSKDKLDSIIKNNKILKEVTEFISPPYFRRDNFWQFFKDMTIPPIEDEYMIDILNRQWGVCYVEKQLINNINEIKERQ